MSSHQSNPDHEMTAQPCTGQKYETFCNACASSDEPGLTYVKVTYGYGNSRSIVYLCERCASNLQNELGHILA